MAKADIPCQKSTALLREKYPTSVVEKVEHWNHFARRRHYLLGFGDLLCVGTESGFLLVQVTTRGQMSARRAKILGKQQPGDRKPAEYAEYRRKAAEAWLAAGGRIAVHGWHQPGGKGTAWEYTAWEITMDEIEQAKTGTIPRKGALKV